MMNINAQYNALSEAIETRFKIENIYYVTSHISILFLNLVFMALLKALCWTLIFIIRNRFPPGTSSDIIKVIKHL